MYLFDQHDVIMMLFKTDVSLELIASFNKMKTITTDLALVVQAVEHSTVLQVLCVCGRVRVCAGGWGCVWEGEDVCGRMRVCVGGVKMT